MNLWLATGTAAVVAAGCCWADGFSVVAGPRLALILPALALAWLALLAYCRRRLPLLLPALDAAAQTIIFGVAIAFLQYPAAAFGAPLADHAMIAFDRWLGFGWRAFFDLVQHRALLSTALSASYNALLIQLPIVILGLGFRDPERLHKFVAANMAGQIIAIIGSALWPVAGAFATSGVDASFNPYPAQFAAARAGAIRTLDLGTMTGIVQFPSYHTILALLIAYAVVRFPLWMAIPIWAFELMIILASPVFGGHYIADIVGGFAAALMAIAIAETVCRDVSVSAWRATRAPPRSPRPAPGDVTPLP